MKAIVVRQPWASLIAHGVKTIETRGFQPRTTLVPGDRLAIVAGKVVPTIKHLARTDYHLGTWSTTGLHADGEDGECPCPDPEDGNWSDECKALNLWEPAILRDERAHGFSLVGTMPLGAVVAVVTYDGALPVVNDLAWCDDGGVGIAGAAISLTDGEDGGLYLHNGDHFGCGGLDIPDQLPLGDFRPGRYGWLLSDPQRIDPVPCPAVRPDGTRTVMQGIFTLPDDVAGPVEAQLR